MTDNKESLEIFEDAAILQRFVCLFFFCKRSANDMPKCQIARQNKPRKLHHSKKLNESKQIMISFKACLAASSYESNF